ncbi:hypothetical protein [Salinicoccus roseus]|uniref:Scaffolding protein n=1 Tax=Salinicoccus roseus TaxID=45670 RepID=A0ABT4YKY8_9STAP|nr:hypothetical protein [Salinicoccus roseus]MDB0581377.1 hypothetical protein [Salinicoccus roseus]
MPKKNLTTWDKALALKLNLQHFAEGNPDPKDPEGGEGGEGSKGTDPKDPEPKDPKDPKDPEGDKSTDVSAEEAQRIAEAQLLKDLGVDSLDAAKSSLQAYNEYMDSKKTDDQKTQDRLKDLENSTKEKDDTIFDLQSKLAASNEGVHADSVDDVVALAKSKVSDKKPIDKAIKEIVEKYPQFKGEDKEEKQTGVFPGNTPSRKSSKVDGFISGLGLKSQD